MALFISEIFKRILVVIDMIYLRHKNLILNKLSGVYK